MAWTSPRTWVALETVTAALMNTHVRDNLNALMVVTTKGDLAVATASVTLTRLAVGSNGDILTADSAATPGIRWSGTGKTASGGVGRNINIANTLTAAANSDQLEQVRITGVFAKSTFTGLTAMQLYIQTAGATASGAGTIDNFYGIYINGAPTLGTTNWPLFVTDGNVAFAATGAGKVFIGDTADANITTGLTINQGAATNGILAFKSSTTTHGMTSTAETDTFALFEQAPGLNGGLGIFALTDGAAGDSLTAAFYLRAVGVGATTATKSTAAGALIYLDGREKSGAGDTGATANSNLVAVGTNGTTQFILDADGDSHQNIGTAWTNFDSENDITLLNVLAAHVTRRDDPLRRNFGKWLREKRERLEELKLVKFNRDGNHFINMSRLTMLHTGALRALGAKLDEQAKRLLLLEKKVLQLAS